MFLLKYEFITTFWDDFSTADKYGEKEIKDTFERTFNEHKDNYIYLTELVLVLNHKIWQYYEAKNKNYEEYEKNKKYMELYNELWEKADKYACDKLKGEELKYFYTITD